MKSTQIMLSGVVLVKNEQDSLERCLKSLSFCDEVIVIDDYSTDSSFKVATKQNARVYKHYLHNDFANQRNFALSKAQGEWVLFIDADEYVPHKLQKEIISAISHSGSVKGYYLRRIDVLWQKEVRYGELGTFGKFGNGKLLRLGKRLQGKWKRKVHEKWNINGAVGTLSSPLMHYPHQTMKEFIQDTGIRAKLHAEALKKEKKGRSLLKVVVWPVGKFFFNFILKLGFFDGVRGFILAIMMSFHSFLAWSNYFLYEK